MEAATIERHYWDRASKDTDVERNFISSVDVETSIDQIMPYIRRGAVLEIGCGIGRLTTEVAKFLPTTQVYGIDISQKMLDLAPTSSVIYRQNDGRTIPFPDESFSSAYSMLVFQHIPDSAKQGYIKEVARVLQPKGTFRVQFVTGSHKGLVNYNTSIDKMVKWFEAAGLRLTALSEGTIHPEWAWITGLKI